MSRDVMVTITMAELLVLREDQRTLSDLCTAGVANWVGYDDALRDGAELRAAITEAASPYGWSKP